MSQPVLGPEVAGEYTSTIMSSSPPHQPASPPVGRRVLVNAGALAGSSLWRVVISFALQLLIARNLGVAGLGLYTVALAYLNVSQVLSELGLPALLVRDLAHTPMHRRAYYLLALRVQVAAAIVVWAGLVGLTFLLPYSPTTRIVLWLVGASLPFYAVTSVTETLFQASERMELLMSVEILINVLIFTFSVLILWLDGTIFFLVSVLVITQAISAAACTLLLVQQKILAGPQEAIVTDLPALRRRMSPFFGLAIADVLLQRMDILLLSVFGGETIIGIYSAAYNLTRVLIKLIQSFWQATYPTLSRLFHQTSGKYPILVSLSLRYGLMLLLPGAALSTGIAAELMHLVYSHGYAQAVPVFQSLIWLAPIFFIETYAVTLLMVEHHPLYSLLIDGLHLVALAILLPILTTAGQAPGAAWAVLLAGLFGASGGLILLHRIHIPMTPGKLWPLLFATLLTLITTLVLPFAWPLRAAVGGTLYVILVWSLGIVALEDYHIFRRALSIGEA